LNESFLGNHNTQARNEQFNLTSSHDILKYPTILAIGQD